MVYLERAYYIVLVTLNYLNIGCDTLSTGITEFGFTLLWKFTQWFLYDRDLPHKELKLRLGVTCSSVSIDFQFQSISVGLIFRILHTQRAVPVKKGTLG